LNFLDDYDLANLKVNDARVLSGGENQSGSGTDQDSVEFNLVNANSIVSSLEEVANFSLPSIPDERNIV